jgi:mono/diheme cytochrome c family protein
VTSVRHGLVVLAASAAVAFGGCGGDEGDSGVQAGSGGAPRGLGAEVYAARCALCHGADLRGTTRGPSHLSEVYEPGHHPDASFRAAIEQGSPAHHWDFGPMPPVPDLGEDEIDAVIAFIRDQQQAEGFEPYPPPG